MFFFTRSIIHMYVYIFFHTSLSNQTISACSATGLFSFPVSSAARTLAMFQSSILVWVCDEGRRGRELAVVEMGVEMEWDKGGGGGMDREGRGKGGR